MSCLGMYNGLVTTVVELFILTIWKAQAIFMTVAPHYA